MIAALQRASKTRSKCAVCCSCMSRNGINEAATIIKKNKVAKSKLSFKTWSLTKETALSCVINRRKASRSEAKSESHISIEKQQAPKKDGAGAEEGTLLSHRHSLCRPKNMHYQDSQGLCIRFMRSISHFVNSQNNRS